MNNEVVSSDQCKPSGFSGIYNNNTHILLPCTQGNCAAVNNVKNPFALPVYEFKPPPVELPVTTEAPEVICPTFSPASEEQSTSVFSSSGFWVGFCFGALVIVAILVSIGLVYNQTAKGKATIAAIKTYRRNEKLYYDRKRRNDVPLHTIDNTPSHSRTPLNHNRNEVGREFDAKTLESSMCSYPSWRRDEGYRSYPNSGSLSGHSKYQESLNPVGPAYGPYYTPTGESKLLSPNKRPLPNPIVKSDLGGSQNLSSSDEMQSDSDSDASYDHPPHPPHWDAKESPTASLNLRNGAFYYEKHFNSHGGQKGSFDEDAYMRSYKAYRAGRRQQRTPEKKVPLHRSSSLEKEEKKKASLEKPNQEPKVEKEETTAMESGQSNTIPSVEKKVALSDAESHHWTADAEKLRRTPTSEVGGQMSDAETQRWASDNEGQSRPVDEKPEKLLDSEKSQWVSDVEVQHRTAERPSRQRIDAERPSRTTGRPRRIDEEERLRRPPDERPRRPVYDDGQRRPTYDDRSRWTPDAEGPRRAPDERTRREPPRQISTERPRRTSTERLLRTSAERPRRVSKERPLRTGTMTERPPRTSAEKTRQGPEAERSRWVPDVDKRPRRTSSERPRWASDADRSRRAGKPREGSRGQQEDPRDYRYAQFVKRGENPNYGRERAKEIGTNPSRTVLDDKRRNVEKLDDRRQDSGDPPRLPQRNRRGDDDFEFPPLPGFLGKN